MVWERVASCPYIILINRCRDRGGHGERARTMDGGDKQEEQQQQQHAAKTRRTTTFPRGPVGWARDGGRRVDG